MNDRKRKLLVRGVLILFLSSVFTYIFWPSTPESHTDGSSTTVLDSTTSTLTIVDTPCVIFFNKNESTFLVEDSTCINTYAQRYFDGVYSQIVLECRTSSDGSSVNGRILSDDRTKTVQLKFTELQVPLSAIDAKSLADTDPLTDKDLSSEELLILNRSCIITGVQS